MHARYKILIPVLVLCVLLGGFALYASHTQAPIQPTTSTVATSSAPTATTTTETPRTSTAALKTTASPTSTAATQTQSPSTTNATLVVGSSRYAITVSQGGATVASVMQQLAATNNSFTYTTKTYPGLGFFVESINGKANSGTAYWFLYVNGQETQTGMSSTTVHPGDVIEWKYQM